MVGVVFRSLDNFLGDLRRSVGTKVSGQEELALHPGFRSKKEGCGDQAVLGTQCFLGQLSIFVRLGTILPI